MLKQNQVVYIVFFNYIKIIHRKMGFFFIIYKTPNLWGEMCAGFFQTFAKLQAL